MPFGENKKQIRDRYRREREQELGIHFGCHRVVSAKRKNGDQRQGCCMVCHQPTKICKCDDRSEWTKARIE